MQHLTYKEQCGPSAFPGFVQSLGSSHSDNCTIIDPASGSGSIHYFDIEPGLQLRIWDVLYNDGLHIYREAQTNKTRRSFTIVYYLNPGSFIAEDCHNRPAVVPGIWNTILLSSDASFRITILPQKKFRCISMHFSIDWLKKNVLCDFTLNTSLLQRFAMTADPFAVFESLSPLEKESASVFFTEQQPAKFLVRSRSLHLMSLFFSNIITRLTAQHQPAVLHAAEMERAEALLVSQLYNGLPDLKTIARQVAVSESTLKRYFRLIYGKNIYQYFLEKRMCCAKQLLLEKNKTVSETASIMGYESVSQFIAMFKKIFALSPGSLRKEKLADL